MEASAVVQIILLIVFIIVGLALIWFLVELVRTVKTARKAVEDIQAQVTPTLEHVEKITEDIKPAIAKIDPLVERVSLTVDAANLEMMRIDSILEDVNTVTDALSSTTNAIDNVANAPLNVVNNVSSRVHSILKGRKSSASSSSLADAKARLDKKSERPHLKETDIQADPAGGNAISENGEGEARSDAEPAERPE